MSETFQHYLAGLIATVHASSACCGHRRSTATSGSSPGRGRRPASAGASTTARSGSARSATARACRVECRIPGSDANSYFAFAGTIAGGLYGIRNELAARRAVRRQRLRGDRHRSHPVEPPRRDRTVGGFVNRQGVLRRRRAPPHPDDGQGRVAGVQPDRSPTGSCAATGSASDVARSASCVRGELDDRPGGGR